uniref:Ctr_155_T conopeptide n=1 Tax=Conus tribblei TaxID=101761 RepID=A0A0C9R702_CONTD
MSAPGKMLFFLLLLLPLETCRSDGQETQGDGESNAVGSLLTRLQGGYMERGNSDQCKCSAHSGNKCSACTNVACPGKCKSVNWKGCECNDWGK